MAYNILFNRFVLQIFVGRGRKALDASNACKSFKKVWRQVMGDEHVPSLTGSGIRYATVNEAATKDPAAQGYVIINQPIMFALSCLCDDSGYNVTRLLSFMMLV